jgi:hypothetical protein
MPNASSIRGRHEHEIAKEEDRDAQDSYQI